MKHRTILTVVFGAWMAGCAVEVTEEEGAGGFSSIGPTEFAEGEAAIHAPDEVPELPDMRGEDAPPVAAPGGDEAASCTEDGDAASALPMCSDAVPLVSSAADPARLQQCLQACQSGIAAIEAFCRTVPDPRIRAICWGARFSATACAGFCYWVYT